MSSVGDASRLVAAAIWSSRGLDVAISKSVECVRRTRSCCQIASTELALSVNGAARSLGKKTYLVRVGVLFVSQDRKHLSVRFLHTYLILLFP